MSGTASELARAALEASSVQALPWLMQADSDSLRAVAWALKDECLTAWTADPPRTALVAERLVQMHSARPDPEVAALAAWAAGIGAVAQGRLDDALVELERAQSSLAALGHAGAASQTLVPKVVALAMLGRHDEALAAGEQARAAFVAQGDGHAAGRVELNLGTLLFRADRHDEAAAMYRSAAVHFARARDAHYSIMADIGLAQALTWRFEFDEALRINERALRRAERRGLLIPQAGSRLAAGRVELLRGVLHRALRELARAVALFEQAQATPQERMEAASALADAYLAVNLLPEAQDLYDQVISRAQAMHAPTEQARALVARARTRDRQGERAAALEDLGLARACFEQAGNRVAIADVELVAGHVHLESGKFEAAGQCAQAALAALAGTAVAGWRLEAQVLAAQALGGQGRFEQAEQMLAATLDEVLTLKLVPLEVAIRVAQGALALQRGHLALAREALSMALDHVEAVRVALPDDEFRAAVAAPAERAHDLLVQTLVRDPSVDAATLLEAIERGRARALSLGLQRPLPQRIATVPHARVRMLRQRWREAMLEGEHEAGERHASALRELEAELLETHRQQRLQAELQTQPRIAHSVRAVRVQAALGTGEAMVVFQLQDALLTACVLTQQTTRRLSWSVPELHERIEALRFQIETPRHAPAALVQHAELMAQRVKVRARELYELVWAPLATLLESSQHVVVVPHRALHLLPWAALHDGQGWLVQRFDLVLAPSVTAWMAARPWQAPQTVLALGADNGSMPHVRLELQALVQALGAKVQGRLGAEATAQAFRRLAPGADIVHLACHGHFRADNPMFSSLALAGDPLTLHDLAEVQLRAGLVVLSACETGLSRIGAGDELVGLVRGFMLAGAGSVLATLWAVSDASTARLMGSIYRALAEGARPAVALCAAQRAEAASGEHPFHWGALMLYGRA